MTIPAQELKVIRIQCDRRIINIIRSDMDLMMHDLSRDNQSLLPATFTQATNGSAIRVSAMLPCFGFVQ